MSDFSSVVWIVLGTVIGLFTLYMVIRLAVRHAIADSRPQPQPTSVPTDHTSADGL